MCDMIMSCVTCFVDAWKFLSRKRAKKIEAIVPKWNALICSLRPLYARLSHVRQMCVELEHENDAILRMKVCGLFDCAYYNEELLDCLSAIEALDFEIDYSSKRRKCLSDLSQWLKQASGFTINPGLVCAHDLRIEIEKFGQIVDEMVDMYSRKLCGVMQRRRWRCMVYQRLYGYSAYWN